MTAARNSQNLVARLRTNAHLKKDTYATWEEAADEIDRLMGEAKRIVGDEQYVISEWLIERASWLEKNSHGEDVLSISAELRWAADAIAAGEHI
jgi:hypothetical protein